MLKMYSGFLLHLLIIAHHALFGLTVVYLEVFNLIIPDWYQLKLFLCLKICFFEGALKFVSL